MKRTKADRLGTGRQALRPRSPSRGVTSDEFVRSAVSAVADASASVTATHVSAGDVVWTLSKGNSLAEARRWVTATGFELELQIWTGPRVPGGEDLSWVRIFTSEELLTETAHAKKRQLEASGWVEDIHTTAL